MLNAGCSTRRDFQESHPERILPTLLRDCGLASSEQCSGFDLVERAMHGNVAPRLAYPVLGMRSAGKAHRLGERGIDLSILEL